MTSSLEGAAPRCTAADLRLQWSCAHGRRHRHPDALERVRLRVERTLAQLEDALCTAPAHDRGAIEEERDEIRHIADEIKRMDVRDARPTESVESVATDTHETPPR